MQATKHAESDPESTGADAHGTSTPGPSDTDPDAQYDFMVVSNRLPVDRCSPDEPGCEDGWRRSPGGLVTALRSKAERS